MTNIPSLFDRPALIRARARHVHKLPATRFLIDSAVESIIDRLHIIQRPLTDIVIVGARLTPEQCAAIKQAARADTAILIDDTQTYLDQHPNTSRILGRSEAWPIAHRRVDAVISLLDLHAVNDVVGALAQMQLSLRPDGVMLGSLFGGDTLFELRTSLMQADMTIRGGISPRISPFMDKLALGNLLQRAHFALPVVDSDIMTVSYRTFDRLLQDIREMGEANSLQSRARGLTIPAVFQATEDMYRREFTQDDGTLAATFEILHFIGWVPHESQQQPLPRGSGQVSLADVLN